MPSFPFVRGLALVSVLAAAFGACSLNPQPIPPGYGGGDESAQPGANGADAGVTKTGTSGSDGGSVFMRDADPGGTGPTIDAGIDSPPSPFHEAGTDDAGTTDAMSDGPVDALAD